MLSANISSLLTFIRSHALGIGAISTSCLCGYWELHTARCNCESYATAQVAMGRSVDATSLEMRETLKTTDAKFLAAMRQREELTRNLQMQSLEQRKSVARLQSALRYCQAGGDGDSESGRPILGT